jgi:hypothetical protein
MSNRERVRILEIARSQACGTGTRLVKLRLNKLAQQDPLALAVRIALEIEDANTQAKKYGGKWRDRNYEKKGELIRDLITVFQHNEWTYGIHRSEFRHQRGFERGVVYFEIPGCEQISFHYDHDGPELPVYEKPWGGQQNSTLRKLFAFVEREFPEAIMGKIRVIGDREAPLFEQERI